MRGVCKGKLGQTHEALADLDKACGIDPHNVQGLQEGAVGKLTLRDFEGALEDMNRALQMDPESLKSLTCRGNALCMLGKLEAALADPDKANQLQPNNPGTLIWRGYVKGNQGDWAGVVAEFDKAEQLEPLDDHASRQRDYATRMLAKPGRSHADEINRITESAQLFLATHLEEVINFAQVKL